MAHNTVTGCRGPALRINNNANAWVHANTLLDNSAGMELTYSASWLTDNVVGRSGGHGISIVGGYNFLEDDVFPQVRGNTVVESDEDGVYLEFADVTLWSNILAFNGRYGVNDATSRVLIGANALYGNSSGGYQSGLEGDEDVLSDPRFVDMDAADYQLTSASPCIDRGYDRDDHTDGLDAAGNPRQVDGNGDGIAHADIGALEYAPVCPDADGDGFLDANCGGEDCDDLDASTYPEAMELPDGVDNDCDGQVDEDDACTGGCCGAGRITAPAAGGRASAAAPWWLGVSLLLGASAVLRRRR